MDALCQNNGLDQCPPAALGHAWKASAAVRAQVLIVDPQSHSLNWVAVGLWGNLRTHSCCCGRVGVGQCAYSP